MSRSAYALPPVSQSIFASIFPILPVVEKPKKNPPSTCEEFSAAAAEILTQAKYASADNQVRLLSDFTSVLQAAKLKNKIAYDPAIRFTYENDQTSLLYLVHQTAKQNKTLQAFEDMVDKMFPFEVARAASADADEPPAEPVENETQEQAKDNMRKKEHDLTQADIDALYDDKGPVRGLDF